MSTAKTMAEVLAEHVIIGHGRTGTYACTNTECGWELVYRGRMDGLMLRGIDPVAREFAAHQEEMLSAAGFGLVTDTKAEALRMLTVNSPRLPNDVRGEVFEAVFDIADKFNLPLQNMGPRSDLVEIGDVCGDVERRIVAMLRARAAALRADS